MPHKMTGSTEIWPTTPSHYFEPSYRKRSFPDTNDEYFSSQTIPTKRFATEEVVRSSLSQLNLSDSKSFNLNSNISEFKPLNSCKITSLDFHPSHKRDSTWIDSFKNHVVTSSEPRLGVGSPTKIRRANSSSQVKIIETLPIVTEEEEFDPNFDSKPMKKDTDNSPGNALVRYAFPSNLTDWRDSLDPLDYFELPNVFYALDPNPIPRVRGLLPAPTPSLHEPWIEEIDENEEPMLNSDCITLCAPEITDVISDEDEFSNPASDSSSISSCAFTTLDNEFEQMEID